MSRPEPVRVHLFQGTRLRGNVPAGGRIPAPAYEIDGVSYVTTSWMPVMHDDGSEGLDVQVEVAETAAVPS